MYPPSALILFLLFFFLHILVLQVEPARYVHMDWRKYPLETICLFVFFVFFTPDIFLAAIHKHAVPLPVGATSKC